LCGPPEQLSRRGEISVGKINIVNETRQVTYISNKEVLLCNHCCSGKSINITLCYALINCFMFLASYFVFLDFKLSSCFECRMFAFGLFPGVCSLNASVSEHPVCSIFIGEYVRSDSVGEM
jgi:hypothetical protein